MRRFSLYEVYTEIRLKEVGEGTSEPFDYGKPWRGSTGGFSYTIQGEIKDENGDKVLKKSTY